MKLKELIEYGKKELGENFEDATIIIKLLVESIMSIKKEKIVILSDETIDDEKIENFKQAVKKVKCGTPVQYITGKQEFMKLDFYVDENVLIPQPDTEILVQEVLKLYQNKECKILDLCTGSGAIGVSLAKYIPNAKVVVSDISMKALQIAKLNAEKNMVHKKMEFIESDMFEEIMDTDFDVVVSNPPYIESGVIGNLSTQVQNEPHLALDGGKDGLDFYRIIVDNAHRYLKRDGRLFLEIGYDQRKEVERLLNNSGKYKKIYSIKDIAKNDRVVVSEVRD